MWESIRQNPALWARWSADCTWPLAQGTTVMTKMGQARGKAADVAGQAGGDSGRADRAGA